MNAAETADTIETIFVVDDEESVRKAIARLLSSVGLHCMTYGSADDLLRNVSGDPAGCVILDVRMPGPSGLEVQRALQAEGVSMPVIFVTGHGDVPITARAMKAGALDVLTKPVDEQTLLDLVHQALARNRQERQQRGELEQVAQRYAALTPREREVMALVATGMLNKQVAAELGTSEKTVKVHRSQVMHKMGAQSLADLVRLADRLGICDESLTA